MIKFFITDLEEIETLLNIDLSSLTTYENLMAIIGINIFMWISIYFMISIIIKVISRISRVL